MHDPRSEPYQTKITSHPTNMYPMQARPEQMKMFIQPKIQEQQFHIQNQRVAVNQQPEGEYVV